MTNKKTSREAKNMKERLSFLEAVVGYNPNAERNGNGIMTLLDELTNKMKSTDERIIRLDTRSSERYNELNSRINKIESTLDILEKQLYNINEQYIKLNNTISKVVEKIETYEKKVKEHGNLMDGVITTNKLMNIVKGAGILATFLLALGTIFGTIAFIYNKIMQ